MQSTIHHVGVEDDVDVHAPAKLYYTTGKNAGAYIRRLKNFVVRIHKKNLLLIRTCILTLLFSLVAKKGCQS